MKISPPLSHSIPHYARYLDAFILGRSLITRHTLFLKTDIFLPWGTHAETIMGGIQKRHQVRLNTLTTAERLELEKTNQRLQGEGKSPIDMTSVTQQIEQISNNDNLSDKDKRKAINDIRKNLGISKKEMKRLFTKRLEKICEQTKNEIQQTLSVLTADVTRMQQQYGPQSPQAMAAAQRLDSATRISKPLLQKLRSNQSLYKSMYKPGGCVKKVFNHVGSFFKTALKTFIQPFAKILDPRHWLRSGIFLPLVLGLFPVLGTAVAAVQRFAGRGVEMMRKIMELPRQ